MTVIVWDGTTLAADKRACYGNVVITVCKLQRIRGHLCGVAGNFSCGMELFTWFAAGAAPVGYPQSCRDLDGGASLICITPGKEVFKYESSPSPFRVEGFAAFGAGMEQAMIALHFGATAVEAVAVTSIYNPTCGNGVDTLQFEEA